MFDLTDQVAIVTGGATHLGKAMATGLAELGATTVRADPMAADRFSMREEAKRLAAGGGGVDDAAPSQFQLDIGS